MSCFTNLDFTIAPTMAIALWVISAAILIWVSRKNWFPGKPAFQLTLLSMLWWLFTVAFDQASQGEACKIAWSLAAWPGITLLPMAWAFFIFDYTWSRARGHPLRRLLYIALPSVVGMIALTNSQTNLLYGTGTRIMSAGTHEYVYFDHGPLFYAVAAVLYIFVMGALGVLVYAYYRAKTIIRPFLSVLLIITAAPLTANMAYVLWGMTFYGFDPTPFMFAVSLIALSWLLINNTMMDTATQGRTLLFYETEDPAIIIDTQCRAVGANSAAQSLFGRTSLQRGKPATRLDKIGPLLRQLVEAGEVAHDDPIHLREKVFKLRVLPIESPIQNKNSYMGWTISLVDITEIEHSAEALREALAHAEAANQAKSQFLAMISHELRTPMTSVKGGLDLALHGPMGEISPQLRNLLTIAQRNSLRLLKLVDDVLDLQKLDLGTMSLQLQDLDADEFLRNILEEYEGFAADKEVRLVNRSPEVNRLLRGDQHRLKQVVGNVISNAVKFSPDGGKVVCTTQDLGPRLRISIKDNGIGIPEGQEDEVFGRFHQVDSSSMQVSGGSGLGMHIAQSLIERMGGGISYESVLGEGTTFHIDVPFSSEESRPEEA